MSDGCVTAALTAMAALVSVMPTAVQTMIRRRSSASPTGPADKAPARKGMSCARLMAPTCSDEWVME